MFNKLIKSTIDGKVIMSLGMLDNLRWCWSTHLSYRQSPVHQRLVVFRKVLRFFNLGVFEFTGYSYWGPNCLGLLPEKWICTGPPVYFRSPLYISLSNWPIRTIPYMGSPNFVERMWILYTGHFVMYEHKSSSLRIKINVAQCLDDGIDIGSNQ